MATLDQVIAQIRFQLEQLSAKNAHHEFEHICRHLTRAKICSNVLPSTGPVSAGGDQGRDFETFRTYLKENMPYGTGFLGLASSSPIAFACTLTSNKNIKTKIQDDINAILASGNPVNDIHIFCSCDITKSKRDEIREGARNEKNIYLEIYDGQAISELLASRDVFWIAERYLGIPAEIYPPLPEGSGTAWYDELLKKWRQADREPNNYSDFSQLKSGIRHATFSTNIKHEIPFWISLLDTLRITTVFEDLKRRATYEIAVAKLRGLESLEGFEEDIREYFSNIDTLTDISQIEDTSTLLSYVISAVRFGFVSLTVEELELWRDNIINRVNIELVKEQQSGRKCSLLNTKAFIYTIPTPTQLNLPTLEEPINCWQELVSIVDNAPLFPLERLSNYFTLMIELGLDSNALYPIIEQVDEILAVREGNNVIGEKSRDRAMAYYKRGEILKAIEQLDRAKLNWFADGSIRGSLLSCLMLSSLYNELNLCMAAKHYALIASYIALHSQDDSVNYLIPKGIFTAAIADYKFGSWRSYFNTVDIGLRTTFAFSDTAEFLESEEFQRLLFYTVTLRTLTNITAPPIVNFIDKTIQDWDIKEYCDDLIPLSEKSFADNNVEELSQYLSEQGLGLIWNDIEKIREVRFAALGIRWLFTWENTYDINCEAEGFLAAFQMFLASLAGLDLALLRTQVNVNLTFSRNSKIEFIPTTTQERVNWLLKLPLSNLVDETSSYSILTEKDIISSAITILGSYSLFSTEKFLELIKDMVIETVFPQAFFGTRYSKAYREFIYKESKLVGEIFKDLQRIDYFPKSHYELEWFGGQGPLYSIESSMEAIRNRYKNSLPAIRLTLNRLLNNNRFRKTTLLLKSKGWKDWHLLLAILNIVTNYRANSAMYLLDKDSPDEFKKISNKLLYEEESRASIRVPNSEFTEKKLQFSINVSMISTLRIMGHEMHLSIADFDAISDFLAVRYRYWEDDVEHDNLGFP